MRLTVNQEFVGSIPAAGAKSRRFILSHELLRLTQKYVNKPQLMAQTEFNQVFDYLANRNASSADLLAREKMDSVEQKLATPEGGVGFIEISGPTLYSKMDAEPMCGPQMASYQRIEEDFDTLIEDPSVNTIVLAVNSPGGEAYGAFETANYMREKADAAGKVIVAYVDGLAASAGYVLSSAAHEIISNPFAEVGSIGVVVKLQNINKMKERAGIEETYIYAGDNKVPFNADGSFQEDFLEDIQNKVYSLYDEFVKHVASLRSLSDAEVRDTQAKTFGSEEAMSLGLIDKVMTRDAFLSSYLPNIVQDKGTKEMLIKSKPETKEFQENMSENSELDVEMVASLNAELAKAKEAIAQLNQEKEDAKISALAAELAELSFLENTKELAAAFVKMGAEADVFKSSMDAMTSELLKKDEAIAELEYKVSKLEESQDADLFVKNSVEGDAKEELSAKELEQEKVNSILKKSK